jgi:hypothetical protein
MAFIQKRDLVRSEPRKFLFAASAWAAGPTIGVWLYTSFGPWAAFLFSAACGLVLLANFFWLQIEEKGSPGVRLPPNPLASIARFATQPRLLLGWGIAFGRTCWWGTYMVYVPLYLVQHGAPGIAGAVLVSVASAMLFLTPLWGRLAARFGLRRVIMTAYLWCAATTLCGALFADLPAVAAGLLMLGALGGTALDAVGNIPFFRAVHAYERPQMMTVFRTYQDCADLGTAAVYAVLLSFLPLPSVFAACGIGMMGGALLARYLPRGM